MVFNFERIKEIEKIIKYDLIVFIICVVESLGEEFCFFYYGIIFSDCIDMVMVLLMIKSLKFI